jgi:hypothetical protein
VQAIFDRMSAAAKPLGSDLIAQEQILDQPRAKSHKIALPPRRRPLPSCKAACARCICRRISKPAPCSTRIRSPVMNSPEAMVTLRLWDIITMKDSDGIFLADEASNGP